MRIRTGAKCFGLMMMALLWGRDGAAFQRTQPVPAPTPDYSGRQTGIQPRTSPFDDQAVREMEEKRGKAMVAERQRMMVKETNQLVQAAAELEAAVTEEKPGMARDEQARRAETIEKLARSVKDRMRGTR